MIPFVIRVAKPDTCVTRLQKEFSDVNQGPADDVTESA